MNSTKSYTLLIYSLRKTKRKCKWASCSWCLVWSPWLLDALSGELQVWDSCLCLYGRRRMAVEGPGDFLGPLSFLLLLLSLLVTCSPCNACLFIGSLCLLLWLFGFEPMPTLRALQGRRDVFHHCLVVGATACSRMCWQPLAGS